MYITKPAWKLVEFNFFILIIYMKLLKSFKKLCSPAQLYLGLSVLSILSMCYQNIGTPNMYTCGLIKAESTINKSLYLLKCSRISFGTSIEWRVINKYPMYVVVSKKKFHDHIKF